MPNLIERMVQARKCGIWKIEITLENTLIIVRLNETRRLFGPGVYSDPALIRENTVHVQLHYTVHTLFY